MEKVNARNSQSMPLWERQKAERGHYSSVDKALQAHRQRKLDRQNRVTERLNLVRDMQSQFFPKSNVTNRPEFNTPTLDPYSIPNQARVENQIPATDIPEQMPEMVALQPMELDDIYNEASLASTSDNALGLVQKEISNPNPEEGPIDDMPKGSYVDYTV